MPHCSINVCVFLLQVSDWWEEYIYLRSRSPIMVNSNFYIMVRNLVTLKKKKKERNENRTLFCCNKVVIKYGVTIFCVQ